MTLNEATTLIRGAIGENQAPETWADLGCGDGLFTRALALLLPANSLINAVDQRYQNIPSTTTSRIEFILADFVTDDLPFQHLHGILMANALHYVKDKAACLQKLLSQLSFTGRIVLVEYEMTQANHWVPYPIPFAKASELFTNLGFKEVRKLGELPSRYGPRNIYACVANR